MELAERVARTIREHRLIERGSAILVGVSGGLDSMVLLHLLSSLAENAAWKLSAAHFNHRLRAAESDADEAFVRTEAGKLGVPFHSTRADVRAAAQGKGVSVEMAARELRHRFLVETARSNGIDRIALAHHRDDNIETFWLKLLRGEAGRGLAGMRWSRPAEASSHIQIIRPLLDVSKSLLREFAKQSRIAFREDASNADATFLRNRIRLEILPRLRSFQPAVDEIVLRTAEVLTAEKDFVETEARSWLDPDRPSPKLPFEALHKAVQREVMRRQLLNFAIQPTFDLIEELRNTPGRVITVSPGRAVSRSDAGVIEEVRPREEIFLHETLAIDASTGGSCGFGRLEFRWEHVEKRDPAEPGVEYFDAAKIGSRPELRTWVAGDRFWPIGLADAAKVQDLLTNLKVPADEKRRRVVAVDSTGKIFWVEGLRISEQHKVTANTGLVLRWTWRPFQV